MPRLPPLRAAMLVWAATIGGCGRVGYRAANPTIDGGTHEPDAPWTLDADSGDLDGGSPDSGDLDGGSRDSGDLDGSSPDSGDLDGGSLDSGDLDGGSLDSGDLDGGSLDSGDLDGGDLDSGDLDGGDLDGGDLDSGDAYVEPIRVCSEYPSRLFCDGFETDFSRWQYPVVQSGTVTRVTDRSFSGAASFLAATEPADGGTASVARYATRVFGPVGVGDLWYRAFYYLPSAVSLNGTLSLLALSERRTPYAGVQVLITPTQRLSMYSVSDRTNIAGTATFARDRWVCVEVHVAIADVSGRFELFVDGVMSAAHTTDTLPASPYSLAEVGIHYTSASASVEINVDDVSLSTTRIGCDAP